MKLTFDIDFSNGLSKPILKSVKSDKKLEPWEFETLNSLKFLSKDACDLILMSQTSFDTELRKELDSKDLF